MTLVRKHRAQLLDKFVEKGESWARARRGYMMTLMVQSRSLGMMANWLGGTHINRDKKGDANGRTPITPVSAEDQRTALLYDVANPFRDDGFGLTPTLLAHLATALLAAREAGKVILDGVFNDVKDLDAFRVECVQGFEMGFDGKTLIHPGQVDICNEVWAPSDADIEHARGLIAAFDEAIAEGKGVVTYNGRMIENLHVANAQRVLAVADAIAAISGISGISGTPGVD